jgi:uncharacterized protein
VAQVNRIDIGLLKGIDRVRDILIENTERFARGLSANNALLWGARGMGKSSLVKAVHALVNRPPGAGSSSSKSTAKTSRPCRGSWRTAAMARPPNHRVLRRPVV